MRLVHHGVDAYAGGFGGLLDFLSHRLFRGRIALHRLEAGIPREFEPIGVAQIAGQHPDVERLPNRETAGAANAAGKEREAARNERRSIESSGAVFRR